MFTRVAPISRYITRYIPEVAEATSPLEFFPLPIDLLVLDLHLPDINGFEIVHRLYAEPRTRAIPVIFFTAATPNEISSAIRLAPRARVLEKPFTYQSLLSAISKALQVP